MNLKYNLFSDAVHENIPVNCTKLFDGHSVAPWEAEGAFIF